MPSVFIAGTDTGVGKTWVTGHLAKYIHTIEKKQVVTQKWVQTGSEEFSPDVREHWRIMGVSEADYAPYKKAIAPYSFSLEASPHLAAEHAGKAINPNRLLAAYSALKPQFEWVLVEGSGGIMTPYNRESTLCDLVERIKIPVLVVVANRLGAINQTLLTLEALKTRRIPIIGVMMNRPEGESLVTQDNADIIGHLGGVSVFKEGEWERLFRMVSSLSPSSCQFPF